MRIQPAQRQRLSLFLFVLLVLFAATLEAQVLSPNLLYTSVQPCRVFDTRSATAGKLIASVPRTFNIVGGNVTSTTFTGQGGTNGGCAIPGFSTIFPQVQAVVINLTVVNTSGAGFLAAYPSDHSWPGTADVNYNASSTIGNRAVVPVRQDVQGGDITLLAGVSNTDVTGDIVGYFSAGSPTPSGGSQNNLFLGFEAGNVAVQTGSGNTGLGTEVFFHNTSGTNNTALGYAALFDNTTGGSNTAVGSGSLEGNTGGANNSAFGQSSLAALTNGFTNTAIGTSAAWALQTGNNNIVIGYLSGNQYTSSESSNILLGNAGVTGESHVIRIGSSSGGAQTSAYIAGIYGVTSSSGTAVYVNSNGQLGTLPSSLRFKEDVVDMDNASDGLMRLRPVAFYYKPQVDDGSHLRQYGLVAEEVAKVYPSLVEYDPDGNPLAVRYQFVNAMLLNEVQRQHHKIDDQQAEIAELQRQVGALLEEVRSKENP